MPQNRVVPYFSLISKVFLHDLYSARSNLVGIFIIVFMKRIVEYKIFLTFVCFNYDNIFTKTQTQNHKNTKTAGDALDFKAIIGNHSLICNW